MICSDCQKIIYSQKSSSSMSGMVATYYCAPCKNEMIVWEDIKLGDCTFEHGRYRLYCDKTNNRSMIQRIYMDIESDTSIMYRWYTILELPAIPRNITQENFEQKLKLYLLFS